jgi:hypothetical protein
LQSFLAKGWAAGALAEFEWPIGKCKACVTRWVLVGCMPETSEFWGSDAALHLKKMVDVREYMTAWEDRR